MSSITQGVCSECSYNDYQLDVSGTVQKKLIVEFGRLYHNPNLYGGPVDRDAPQGYAQRRAQLLAQLQPKIEKQYAKPVLLVGFQDPYPFQLCQECIENLLKEFD
jgi:hypothetical protein